jgi:hypothetical protein
MKVTGELVSMALDATCYHRSQVQGFCTPALLSDYQRHYIRDLTKPNRTQLVWEHLAPEADYASAHQAILRKQEAIRAQIIADRLNVLLGVNACVTDAAHTDT